MSTGAGTNVSPFGRGGMSGEECAELCPKCCGSLCSCIGYVLCCLWCYEEPQTDFEPPAGKQVGDTVRVLRSIGRGWEPAQITQVYGNGTYTLKCKWDGSTLENIRVEDIRA